MLPNGITQLLKLIPLRSVVHKWLNPPIERSPDELDDLAIRTWRESNCPIPAPSAYKHRVLREYAQKFNIHTMIETGTFVGENLQRNGPFFKQIYSIELSPIYYNWAKENVRQQHITLIQGDSGKILPVLLETIREPAIFWLDGHYSGDNTARGKANTPIREELNAILAHSIKDHVILIDDARHFTGDNDYPTLDSVRDQVMSARKYSFVVKHDIVRIVRDS